MSIRAPGRRLDYFAKYEWACANCFRRFRNTRKKENGVRLFCSRACRMADHTARRSYTLAHLVTEGPLTTKTAKAAKDHAAAIAKTDRSVATLARSVGPERITPYQSMRMRAHIFGKVRAHLELADEVVSGTRTWSPTQARVFQTLINKVLPDLSQSHTTHEHVTEDITRLSREDLEAIASGVHEAEARDEIDDAEVISSDRPSTDEPLDVDPDHPAGPPGPFHPELEPSLNPDLASGRRTEAEIMADLVARGERDPVVKQPRTPKPAFRTDQTEEPDQ